MAAQLSETQIVPVKKPTGKYERFQTDCVTSHAVTPSTSPNCITLWWTSFKSFVVINNKPQFISLLLTCECVSTNRDGTLTTTVC